MLENKAVFENDSFRLYETGRDYDFVAIIENKTDKPIAIGEEDDDILEQFTIKANDWVGLTSVEYLKVRVYLGLTSTYILEDVVARMDNVLEGTI